MNEQKFRDLKADEIDVRVGSVKKDKGMSLLLYKDARADMNILDETVGVFNWKREHTVINENLFATVSLWDSAKGQWISKQDVGTESNTEKEKGEASDSFKRACFNWGIGRKLYTSPFIWISSNDTESIKFEKYSVQEISYNEVSIVDLVIIDSKGNVVFTTKGKIDKPKRQEIKKQEPKEEPKKQLATKFQIEEIMRLYTVEALYSMTEYYKVKALDELDFATAEMVIKRGHDKAKEKKSLDNL